MSIVKRVPYRHCLSCRQAADKGYGLQAEKEAENMLILETVANN
jgi:hypothetical protein